MAVHVVRGDDSWNVVVIWTGLVRRLNQREHPEHKLALQTFVHELVHVDDLRLFTRTYPGGWRAAKPRDGRDANLQPTVNPCQSEYSAQRRAAWAAPEHGLDLLEMLGEAMKDVDDQIRSARLSYRLHGDMEKYWPVVVERLKFLFQAIGYGLGLCGKTFNKKSYDAALNKHKNKRTGYECYGTIGAFVTTKY